MPAYTEKIRMLIVLVNYYNDDEVCGFVNKELLTQLLEPIHIIVVNNGSHNQGGLAARLKDGKITLLDPGKNLGYLNAFLTAIDRFYSVHSYYPDLMVLCNTDMYLRGSAFLSSLYSKYKDMDHACVGPSIISTRFNTDQNPYMIFRISKFKLYLLRFVDNYYLLYLLYQFISLIKNTIRQFINFSRLQPVSGPVYALHGSFIMFSNLFVGSAINDLRNAPFLFGEEVFIAEVARKHNMNLYYDSSFSIDHHEHATTGTFKSRKMIKYEQISLSQLIERFFK